MTFYSLRVVDFPPDATVEQLESFSLSSPIAQSLSRYAEDCGPYGLSGWAEPRGHPLYYVDNCWVRALVHGRDLPDFFRDVLKGEPKLNPDIQPDERYLIEAEEY